MFSWLRRRKKKNRHTIVAQRPPEPEEFRGIWSHLDSLSPQKINSLAVRRVWRNRARTEVLRNCYAIGVVRNLACCLIGAGPRLQLQTPDDELNSFIEREFDEWADAVGLNEKLLTMAATKVVDGEVFGLFFSNGALTTLAQLDLRLIEADRITAPLTVRDGGVDGIVFDEWGNPARYMILRESPDELLPILGPYDIVPAESVVHWFRVDRPGQVRGLPELIPALPLFAQLRRYGAAVASAAEISACFAGLLYTDCPPGGEAEEVAEGFKSFLYDHRMLCTLPAGYKLEQLKAEQPITNYPEYVRQVLSEIYACLSIPYAIGACDASQHNFASGRLDHQMFWRMVKVLRKQLERILLRRLLRAWIDEALLSGQLRANVEGPWPHVWHWDGEYHVDPEKEANAATLRLSNNTTTLAQECARLGMDWEEVARQRAREKRLLKELELETEKGIEVNRES